MVSKESVRLYLTTFAFIFFPEIFTRTQFQEVFTYQKAFLLCEFWLVKYVYESCLSQNQSTSRLIGKTLLKAYILQTLQKKNDDELVIFSFIKSVDRYLDACNKRSQKRGCVNCFSQLLNTYKLMLNLALL